MNARLPKTSNNLHSSAKHKNFIILNLIQNRSNKAVEPSHPGSSPGFRSFLVRNYSIGSLRQLYYLLFIIAMFFSSCNKKTAVTKSPENLRSNEVLSFMQNNLLQFDQLKARIKVKADLNGDRQSFNADLRWERDKKIWMSFSIFGIEGVRVLLEAEGIQIMDKMRKKYYNESYEYLYELTGLDLSFDDVQNALLGDLIGLRRSNIKPKKFDDKYILKYNFSDILNATADLNSENITLSNLKMKHPLESQQMTMDFDDYRQFPNGRFAFERDIQASVDNNRLSLQLSFVKIEVASDLSFPFIVNENYQRVE